MRQCVSSVENNDFTGAARIFPEMVHFYTADHASRLSSGAPHTNGETADARRAIQRALQNRKIQIGTVLQSLKYVVVLHAPGKAQEITIANNYPPGRLGFMVLKMSKKCPTWPQARLLHCTMYCC
jgi:hypothetical protein